MRCAPRCTARLARQLVATLWLNAVCCCAQAADYIAYLNGAALHSAANASAPTLAQIPAGATVEVRQREGNWLNVRYRKKPTASSMDGWVFAASLWPTAAQRDTTPPTQVGKYWLLAIGIDRYQYWPTLNSAVRDARAVVDTLVDNYGVDPRQVLTLYDEDATAENIIRTLVDLGDKLASNDALFIYYAGHGILDKLNLGYWVPSDAHVGRWAENIYNKQVNDIVAHLPARHVFLVADACFSGSLFAKGDAARIATPGDISESLATRSRQALTSGGLEEVADSGGGSHSIFARQLLDELRENARSDYGAAYLSARVQQRMAAKTSRQTPQWGHLTESNEVNGEFYLFRSRVKNMSSLLIDSQPYGASIQVDGENMGTAPVTLFNLRGNVEIVAQAEGFAPTRARVEIKNNEQRSEKLNLTRLSPQLVAAGPPATPPDRQGLEHMLREVELAYRDKNLDKLVRSVRMSPQQRTFIGRLFEYYARIDLKLDDYSMTKSGSDVKINMQIKQLVQPNGDIATPSGQWRRVDMHTTWQGDGWTMLTWDK